MLLVSCATVEPGVYSGGGRGLHDPHSGNNLQDLRDCREIWDGGTYLVAGPVAGRPGSRIEVRHALNMGNFAWNIPLRCVTEWRVVPADAATLSDNRRFLDIRPDATPGQITLTATTRGDSTSLTIPILDPDTPNIYGSWSPVEAFSCAGEELPSVVSLRPDGRLFISHESLGNRPGQFSYSFDPAAGTFSMGSLTGRVRLLDDGRIVFSGIAFPGARPLPPLPPGAPPRPSPYSCELEFYRVGELY